MQEPNEIDFGELRLGSPPGTMFSCWQGKFIRINFDVTGYIVGANIETCILC